MLYFFIDRTEEARSLGKINHEPPNLLTLFFGSTYRCG